MTKRSLHDNDNDDDDRTPLALKKASNKNILKSRRKFKPKIVKGFEQLKPVLPATRRHDLSNENCKLSVQSVVNSLNNHKKSQMSNLNLGSFVLELKKKRRNKDQTRNEIDVSKNHSQSSHSQMKNYSYSRQNRSCDEIVRNDQSISSTILLNAKYGCTPTEDNQLISCSYNLKPSCSSQIANKVKKLRVAKPRTTPKKYRDLSHIANKEAKNRQKIYNIIEKLKELE